MFTPFSTRDEYVNMKIKGGVPFSEDFQVKFKSGAMKSLLKLGS